MVDVFLRDYDGVGGYTEISSGTSVDRNWQRGARTFVEKTIVMAAVDYVVPPAHQLELRFIVRSPGSNPDMWFAYDTELYSAILKITREYRIGGTPFYLHNDPTPPVGDTPSHVNLPMDSTIPVAATLFNYDTDRDNKPGLLVQKSPNGILETDPKKYQVWRSAPLPEDLVIEEDSSVDFWAAVRNFEGGKRGEVMVFLRDRDPGTGGYAEIGSGTVFDPNWHQNAVGVFANNNITIADPDYIIPAGHQLEAKFVIDEKAQEHMWFAYDTVLHPAVVIPSVVKNIGSSLGATIEFQNAAAFAKLFSASFSESDFQQLVSVCPDPASLAVIMCDFGGDLYLKAVPGVWEDFARTRLKPGIYYTRGELTLDASAVRGEGVTFVAKRIVVVGTDCKLTNFSGGKNLLFFATGADPEGVAVELVGGDYSLAGLIYAPSGAVEINASRVFIDGSVVSHGFTWSGSVGLITFDADLLEG
jgi:hypothetical protein